MKVDNCRLCRVGKLSEPKLQFPPTPLANEFVKTTQPQEVFPLEVCICQECGHYQLNESIPPERLFRNYLYVAGTSSVNVEHFRQYAVDMVKKYQLIGGGKSKVLDIASNDGTLLKHFKDLGMSVLGIDPAKNLADEANKNGIPTIPEFFTDEYADTILEQYGKFDLITANNVFAHVPDLANFVRGVKKLLTPNGIFTFEVSYFADVCDHLLFDTIYHEHSSYHTIAPLDSFFIEHGMVLSDVDFISNHGGSIRVHVGLNGANIDYAPSDLFHDFDISDQVTRLQKDIKLLGYELREKLEELKSQGKLVAIYGTPAKLTTLMYSLGLKRDMFYFAVDDAPLKQGTYTPGMHIPIKHPDELSKRKPDYVLVLAWNFYESIIKNHPEVAEYGGKWIVPIPELKVI